MENNNQEEKRYIVYCHISPSGKRYIGATRNSVEERAGNNGSGYRGCTTFYNAIQKYGWDNFEHVILESNLDVDEAFLKEKYYISLFDTTNPLYGYNISPGGAGCISEDGSKRIKLAQKKKKAPIGRVVPKDERQKISDSVKKYHSKHKTKKGECPIEVKEKNKESKRYENKIIVKKDMRGKILSIYESSGTASLENNINQKQISAVINGEQKTAGGFVWERLKDHVEKNGEFDISLLKFNPPYSIIEHLLRWLSKYDGCNDETIIEHCKFLSNVSERCVTYAVWWDGFVDSRTYSADGKKNKTMRSIVQLDKSGSYIRTFECMRRACELYNVTPTSLTRCCQGKIKTTGGYKWMYAEDYYKDHNDEDSTDE